jgi:putative transport protein
VCTHPLSELDVINHHGVTISRVFRSGIEFIPNGHTRLQFGDIVTVIGYENHVDELAKEFGNSKKQLSEPNIAGLFIGIAIGVIFGSIPLAFPGIPVPVKLGLAGGPLIAAILISRYGSLFPITSYVTQSANYMVREIGIVLFLSSVGLKAGPAFVQTILSSQGLTLVLLGLCITIIPLIITSLVGKFFCKLNFLEIFGLLAGASTDPPALSFTTKMVGSDAPAIVYASVYPLTMFLRILVAQIIILIFV